MVSALGRERHLIVRERASLAVDLRQQPYRGRKQVPFSSVNGAGKRPVEAIGPVPTADDVARPPERRPGGRHVVIHAELVVHPLGIIDLQPWRTEICLVRAWCRRAVYRAGDSLVVLVGPARRQLQKQRDQRGMQTPWADFW